MEDRRILHILIEGDKGECVRGLFLFLFFFFADLICKF